MKTSKQRGRGAGFANTANGTGTRTKREPWYVKPIRERDGMSVGFRATTIKGTFVAETFWDRWPFPLCTIWLRWEDKQRSTLSIIQCYVPEGLRRLGLMTWTFREMKANLSFRVCDTIRTITTEVSTAESEPWLRKMGFVKKRDGWVFEVKP